MSAAICFALIYNHKTSDADPELVHAVELAINEECYDEFGIGSEGYNVIKAKIHPNQFLADILLPFNISYSEITQIAEKSKKIYDIRKLNSGKNYTVLCLNDSSQRAEFFIYELSPVEFIVYDLRDTLNVYRGSRPTKTETQTASGIINSSLYQTLVDQNLSPTLAMELADIYAWSIDFYRIQKGDAFKVIYTVKKIEDEMVGINEIQAAVFYHFNSPYYAFEFRQGTQSDYFDEEGNSLRKAFLQAPLKFSRISSGFSNRRFHPVQKRYKAHLGTDYAAPSGTPIMTVGDGIVVEAQYKQYNGNYVKVKHNSTYTTQYLHMSKIATGIKPSVRVKQGQTIGYVGSTGLATGPHVCFRFWKNGAQIDHRREKIPPSEPVHADYKEAYNLHLNVWKEKLDSIKLPNEEVKVSES